MINKFKPISISLSPNVQKDDVWLSLKLIFQPLKWVKGRSAKDFELSFLKWLGVKYVYSFNSGRSSLFAILKALDLKKGSSVFLQAFTCNAVPNPVLWAGLNPIYVDCQKDLNMDIQDLREKLSQNRSLSFKNNQAVLVVQHTFGLPSKMDEIMKIANEHGLTVIEDCAHALGGEYNGRKLGTFGKASFFSFSRDKVISSVYGGMVATDDSQLAEKLAKLQKEFGRPSYFWTFQQIIHPVFLNFIILPVYNFFDLGKIFLVLSQWLGILSKAVSWREKRGLKPPYFPKSMPNALAIMAANQFKKLDDFNSHRKKIADFYFDKLKNGKFIFPQKEGVFLRLALQHQNAHQIIYSAWHKENILLGDWYTSPIAPDDTNLSEVKYEKGYCKNAEESAKITLNLPTHINISLADAERIVNFLKKFI